MIVIGYKKKCRYIPIYVESIFNYFHNFRRPVKTSLSKLKLKSDWEFQTPLNRQDDAIVFNHPHISPQLIACIHGQYSANLGSQGVGWKGWGSEEKRKNW